MTILEKLRAQREELLDKMRQMLALADGDGEDVRDLTDEETVEYDAWAAKVDKINADIGRHESLEANEARAAKEGDEPIDPDFPPKKTRQHSEEFESMGEFMCSVALRQNDPRLQDCYQEWENCCHSQ